MQVRNSIGVSVRYGQSWFEEQQHQSSQPRTPAQRPPGLARHEKASLNSSDTAGVLQQCCTSHPAAQLPPCPRNQCQASGKLGLRCASPGRLFRFCSAAGRSCCAHVPPWSPWHPALQLQGLRQQAHWGRAWRGLRAWALEQPAGRLPSGRAITAASSVKCLVVHRCQVRQPQEVHSFSREEQQHVVKCFSC